MSLILSCPQYDAMKINWTCHHTGNWRFVWWLVLNASAMQFSIKFITNARIKAILKRKHILYCKYKIPSTTYMFRVLFQLKAFT